MDNDVPDAAERNSKQISRAKALLVASSSYKPKKTNWIPDWRDISNYSKIGNSKPHWAWEFLRRNRKFQRECDDPSVPYKDENGYSLDFKHRWGLEAFKPYDSEFRPGKNRHGNLPTNQSPVWAATIPARLDGTSGGPIPRSLPFNLQEGQVAVVYDLNFAIHDERMLHMQIAYSMEALEGVLERLRTKKAVQKTDSPNRTSLQKLLRVADAIGANDQPSRSEIGRQFQKDGEILMDTQTELEVLGNEDFSKAIGPLMMAAYDLIYGRGYLQLLTDQSHLEKIAKKFATQIKS